MVCFVSLNKSFTFKNKLFTSRSKIKYFTDCGFIDPSKIVVKTEVLDLTLPSTSAEVKQEISDNNSAATFEANYDITVASTISLHPIPMITELPQPQVNMSESESIASLTVPDDFFDALEFESMEDIEIKSEIKIEEPRFNVPSEQPEAPTPAESQVFVPFAEPQVLVPFAESQVVIPVFEYQFVIPITEPRAIIPDAPVYIRYVNIAFKVMKYINILIFRCLKCEKIVDKDYIYYHLATQHLPKLKVKRLSRRNYPQFVCKKCSELFRTRAMLIKHLEPTITCETIL